MRLLCALRVCVPNRGLNSYKNSQRRRDTLLYDFEVGDKVRWVSHSRGQWTEKRGTVVEIVPAQRGVMLDKYRGQYNLSPFSKGMPRLHKSYVVAVPVEKGKPKLYWPRANQLEPADETE